MFPDSTIAAKFSCARTKTTQILNNAIMPSLQEYNVNIMRTQPFSLVNDGTSDTGLKKMNAVCTLLFDVNRSKEVVSKSYYFFLCSSTTYYS